MQRKGYRCFPIIRIITYTGQRVFFWKGGYAIIYSVCEPIFGRHFPPKLRTRSIIMEQREKLQLVIEQLEERIAPGVKCNSGGGNGSELENGVDCDPGNSGLNNNGKD